jgi:hypothetical protein
LGGFAIIRPVRFFLPLLAVLALGGCASSLAGRLTLPDRYSVVRDQLVIHGDFPLSVHHRLFEELTSQRADLCRRLALPTSDEPIHVYLFETQERFEGFMRLHHPEFPDRRAFFVETDTRLSVYAQWGDRMAYDLRHEVTHGYLHSVVPDIPQWIDEGIAKYYEVPRGQRGVNRPLLDRLVARIKSEHWQPDLQRLEKFPPDYNMTQDDYAEAWAWGHLLMESRPECLEMLRSYLAELRRDGLATPLSTRLAAKLERPNAALLEHVQRLESGNWQPSTPLDRPSVE